MAAEVAIDVSGVESLHTDELTILVSRLENGERLIERYRAAGRDTQTLEDHWIELLREYEERFDALVRRAA